MFSVHPYFFKISIRWHVACCGRRHIINLVITQISTTTLVTIKIKRGVFRVDNPFSNMFSSKNISPNHINTSKHQKNKIQMKKKCLNRAWFSFWRMLNIKKIIIIKLPLSKDTHWYKKRWVSSLKSRQTNDLLSLPFLPSLSLFYKQHEVSYQNETWCAIMVSHFFTVFYFLVF